jgi:hypothetical protein
VLPGASWTILGAWLLLGLAFTGIGALVRRAWRAPVADANEWFGCFWLGWAATLYGLQLWHFVLPVDGRALVVVAITGAAGIVSCRASVWRALARGLRARWPALLVFAIVALWLANRALGGRRTATAGSTTCRPSAGS